MRALLLALALPAKAFENDYAALFATHADRVQQAAPGERRLELPGPVVVVEITKPDGTRRYDADDLSGLGAAGCAFGLLTELVLKFGHCKGGLSDEELVLLEGHLLTVAHFVAENAYPAMSPAKVRPRLLETLRVHRARLERIGALQCDSDDSGRQDAAEIARNLARPGGAAAIDRVISLPRLPVSNPCH